MRHVRQLIPAVVFLLVACGDDPSGPGAPASIAFTAGADQTATVGTPFAAPLTVTVADAANRVVPGVEVAWSVEAGGGMIDRASTETDHDGRASVRWTAGTVAGPQRLSANVEGVASVSITLHAEAGAPVVIQKLSGDGQIAEPGSELPEALVVALRDQYDNPVTNRAVHFTASAGTLTDTLPATSVTGVVSTRWTVGTGGQQSVTASVPGTSAVFTAWGFARDELPVLESGVQITGLAAPTGTPRLYRIPVAEGTARLTVSIAGPNGDADLYVRPGAYPTTTVRSCASTTPVSAETCTIEKPAAGDWFVLLDAWSEYSGLTLGAEWFAGGSMQVSVTGMPADSAAISMEGPHGYQTTISESVLLEGLDPGVYTLTADHVQLDDDVYVATPGVQQVNVVSGAQVDVSITYAASGDVLNLDIIGAHFTQSVQRTDGSIPLVAGRDALLRVFARGNAATTARPPVRARIYHDGVLVDTRTAETPVAGVPIVPDDETLTGTWNIPIPGTLIQPGMSFVVDIDPDDAIAETREDDNTYPAAGTPAAPDVRVVAPFRARMVPVQQSVNGLLGDVTGANLDSWLDHTFAVYPMEVMDVDIRAPYTFTGALASQYDSTWDRLLQEVRVLRIADGSDRYYYGVIKPSYNRGGTGYGYIGHPAAVGVDWENVRHETLAHEWGHNFGRRHVGCGGPASPDPGYPYDGGALGHPGWDVHSGTLWPSGGRYDLMSYCDPTWSSDYTYEAVMLYRESEAAAAAAAEPALVVWGRITEDGVVLEPAFETVTRPLLPRGGGRYTLTFTAEDGTTLSTVRFEGDVVDHDPDARHFAYAVPLRMLRGRAPAALRLSGGGVDVVRSADLTVAPAADMRVTRVDGARVRLQWDADRSPLALVRDARTGEVLSFARSGDAVVQTDGRELQVDLSNGVRSHLRRTVMPR